MKTQLPHGKGHSSPLHFLNLRACARIISGQRLLWPNGCMDQDAIWYVGRPRPRPHYVRWGPSPPRKGTAAPHFPVHACCRQTAGWIKMILGMEVDVGSGNTVIDGDPASLPKKGQSLPNFRPILLWPNGWMHQDATWYGGRPQPRRLCVRWGPSPPLHKKGRSPPVFGPCLWTSGWMDEDATWYGSISRPRPQCV